MSATRSRVARCAASVTLAIAAALAVAPVGSADPPELPAPPVLAADLSAAVAGSLGIGADEAKRRLDAQADQAGQIDGLRTAAGDAYAGEHFDGAGALVVNVTTDAAADAVRRAGGAARLVRRTWAELIGIRDALDAHAGTVGTSWGIDPSANRVVVSVAENATGTDALLASAASYGDAVTVERVSGSIELANHLAGGFPIYPGPTTSSRCSAGFNTAASFVYTAGHCTAPNPNGTVWYGHDRGRIGPQQGGVYPSSDYGLIRNDTATALPCVYGYDAAGTCYQVSTAREAAVGENTCKSGSTTGLTCGTVLRKGVTANYGNGPVFNLDETNICARPGDSGGSHFTTFTALGLTSGGNLINGQCTNPPRTFFQPIVPALNAFGQRIYTGNDAAFAGQSVPATMTAGQGYTVSVSMTNTGRGAWFPNRHRLGSQNPPDNMTWGLNRVNVPAQVNPGATATFTFTVTAPSAPGVYNFQWRMIEDGVEWFGATTPNVAVNVAGPATPVQGAIEAIDRYGVVTGWARDPGAPDAAITVRFTVDGANAGSVVANRPHPTAGNHGFAFVLPRQYLDGQPHTLVAYGVDVTGDPDAQLGQPVTFTRQRIAARADFDGDARSDVSVWRDGDATWYTVLSGTGQASSFSWGLAGDRIVPGDYDGDLRTDHAIFRPGTGEWWIRRSSDGAIDYRQFGLSTDETVAADYTGDGRTDVAVWRESDSTWYVWPAGSDSWYAVQFGLAGDRPVAGDYDGDGKADLAVWRPAAGVWIALRSSDGQVSYQQWGSAGDRPVPADYDGDGRTDAAVYRPSDGVWYILRSFDGAAQYASWGAASDVLAPADYDGDGRTDVAVWRPSDGTWWRHGTGVIAVFGAPGDLPVPRAYLPAG